MSGPEVLIVADDLTGALDTATPFALAGRRVVCAVRPEALAAALATNAEVVVVNTVTRHVAPDIAAQIVGDVARAMSTQRPALVFKKIDSRLKGNVGAETAALAETLGFRAALVAPAIPDQGRWTVAGMVTGHGVSTPLPIAPHFAGHDLAIEIAEVATAADLTARAATIDWRSTLAVGARGLGQALAGATRAAATAPFTRTRAMLFAIGSHDPITLAQVAALTDAEHVGAPLGMLAALPTRLPAIIRSTGTFTGADSDLSARFAQGVVQSIDRRAPDCVLICGGDTALAVLDALEAHLVAPKGEAGPGLPWFELHPANRRPFRAIVKSGGFGAVDALAALLPGA
jgi:D-threonate/D-erythronate kinase